MAVSCNPIVNGGFETGALAPWRSAPGVAAVVNGTYDATPYSGEYCLSLTSAPGNRGNTISQVLTGLDTTANYTFNAQAYASSYTYGNYCSAYVYIGSNATTGHITNVDFIYQENAAEWNTLTGHFVPRHSTETLHLVSVCRFSGSSYTGNVLFDDISLAYPGSCGPKVLDDY